MAYTEDTRMIILILLLLSTLVCETAVGQTHPAQLVYFNPDFSQSDWSRLIKRRPRLIPVRNGEASYRKILMGTPRADLYIAKASFHPVLSGPSEHYQSSAHDHR